MDLRDSPADAEFRANLRAWLEENLPVEWRAPGFWTRVPEERSFCLRRSWEARKARAGWTGIDVPTDYGGRGGTPRQKTIHDEELGRVRAPLSVNRPGLVFLAPTILAIGTQRQKRELVPPILRTDTVWCQGFSEPNAGTDLAALSTRAEDDGDSWVLNGQKTWTSNARYADQMFCLARTSREDDPRRGLAMLLIDMSLRGIEVRPIKQLTGARDFGEVFFTDVRVPKDGVLGAPGDGWRVATLLLSIERGSAGIEKYATFKAEFGDVVQHMRDVGRRGSTTTPNPMLRQQLGQLYIELEALRLHSLHVLTQQERGGRPGAESSVTKLQWSETHQRMGELFTDLDGLSAVESEAGSVLGLNALQYLWLWSRAETIYGGSSQVQRNIIAEHILGLPR